MPAELNEKLTHIIAKYLPDIQVVLLSLRDIILNVSPELNEEFKWSMPNYSYKGKLICYLQAGQNHVNLGFHKGKELEKADAAHLLQGSGKRCAISGIKSRKKLIRRR